MFKRFMAMACVIMMSVSLVACGGSEAGKNKTTTKAEESGIDMSKYPAEINEWTAENFNDYFKEAGLYTKDEFIYVQDHETYYAGLPIDTCGGYMDDEGLYFTGVFILDPDSTEADGKAFLEHVKANKAFTEDLGSLPIDHLVGNVAFMYGLSVDEEFYNAFDAAYNELVEKLGVTPEF